IAVSDERVVGCVALRVLDVLRPLSMIVDRIDAQADAFSIALVELRFEPRHIAELGRANRREILRMRKQYSPAVADPVMEADRAFSRFGREIRRVVANA